MFQKFILLSPVITLYTPGLNFKTSIFCTWGVFLFSLCFSEWTNVASKMIVTWLWNVKNKLSYISKKKKINIIFPACPSFWLSFLRKYLSTVKFVLIFWTLGKIRFYFLHHGKHNFRSITQMKQLMLLSDVIPVYC